MFSKYNIKNIFRCSVTRNSVVRHSAILTLFALLIAVINIFYMNVPIIETIWQKILTFHIIGFSIIWVLNISGVHKMKGSLKKGILLLLLFVFGGWIGFFNCFIVYKYILRSQVSADWFQDSFVSTSFYSIFFSFLITSYETLRDKLNKTVIKLSEKEISEQNILRLKTKAELEALRAKVNPHFLFNTLNSIASLIPQDPVSAEAMVLKLSDLFRYTLDASMHDFIKLPREIYIIREYLEIEKIRLGNRLRYTIEMDKQLDGMMIPGLLLQPLVENSVKHGIAKKQSGGEISIRCFIKDENCHIVISDTCGEFLSSYSDGGFGLFGVRERLDLLYGDRHRLEITSDKGFRIKICLPLDKNGDLGK